MPEGWEKAEIQSESPDSMEAPVPRRARRFATRRAGRRTVAEGARDLSLLVVPTALSVAALLLMTGSEAWSRSGAWTPSGLAELFGWTLLAALAALHQPLTPHRPAATLAAVDTLALGAVALPALALRLGVLPAAAAAAVANLVASWARRRALRNSERVPGILPGLEGALLLAASVLAGGAWLTGRALPRAHEWVLAAFTYGLVLAAARVLLPALRRRRSPRWIDLGSVAVDLLGWLVGVLLLATQTGTATFFLYAAFAMLAAEAARHAVLHRRAGRRIDSFARLTEGQERILGETSGEPGIAQQIYSECRHILPVQWFQLELPDGRSWAAGPDGRVVEGVPEPPPRPAMLPGIHRRAVWHRMDVPLVPPVEERPGKAEKGDAGPSLGTVRLWSDPRRLEDGAEDLLWRLVPQMASSLERSYLDREARLDPLTGVPVRRVFQTRLQQAYRRACDEGRPLAAIVCDIDHFKKVNDTWGHAAGDEALKAVASVLDDTRRDDDVLCRWGGEEFTVLLEHTDGDSALRLAERLRVGVEAIDCRWEGERLPLTLSLGVAAFPELTIKAPSELLLLADEALYEAKARGRNQSLLHCGRGAFRAP
ncbi:MAG: GGDEF domain-containing protein [Thermoanaerobaculia bacterium]|nr:GGDEF domain-containing protein [Thermoanaerobaculia bacterium]